MLLQSEERYDCIADYDAKTGKMAFLSKTLHPELKDATPQGFYSSLDGVMVLFYRSEDELSLRIGEQVFSIDDATGSALIEERGSRTFVLTRGSITLTAFRYIAPKPNVPLEEDPTPFVEEEHFDLLMLVNNVLKDPARRKRLFNQ